MCGRGHNGDRGGTFSTLPDPPDRRSQVFPHPFPHDRLHRLRAAELERAARLGRLLRAVRRRRR
ncbi:hypothetical protein DEH69_13315 [Streptomyces sp. PT12]|nr:hypothetical protein DEH69_13315 [Streptomyces sp. PT12]